MHLHHQRYLIVLLRNLHAPMHTVQSDHAGEGEFAHRMPLTPLEYRYSEPSLDNRSGRDFLLRLREYDEMDQLQHRVPGEDEADTAQTRGVVHRIQVHHTYAHATVVTVSLHS
jgi:hypothetical protein